MSTVDAEALVPNFYAVIAALIASSRIRNEPCLCVGPTPAVGISHDWQHLRDHAWAQVTSLCIREQLRTKARCPSHDDNKPTA